MVYCTKKTKRNIHLLTILYLSWVNNISVRPHKTDFYFFGDFAGKNRGGRASPLFFIEIQFFILLLKKMENMRRYFSIFEVQGGIFSFYIHIHEIKVLLALTKKLPCSTYHHTEIIYLTSSKM